MILHNKIAVDTSNLSEMVVRMMKHLCSSDAQVLVKVFPFESRYWRQRRRQKSTILRR